MTYTPFAQMKADLAKKPGVTNPGGLAAFVARRKYGNKALETAAKSGHSLRNAKPLRKGKHHKQIAAFVKRNSKGA